MLVVGVPAVDCAELPGSVGFPGETCRPQGALLAQLSVRSSDFLPKLKEVAPVHEGPVSNLRLRTTSRTLRLGSRTARLGGLPGARVAPTPSWHIGLLYW